MGTPRFSRSPLAAAVALALTAVGPGAALAATGALEPGFGPLSFDTSFLGAGDAVPDVSRFEKGAMLPPGVHELTVTVNSETIGDRAIRVVDTVDGGFTRACLSAAELTEWGVRLPDATTGDARDDARVALADACIDFMRMIPGATATLRPSSLELRLSVPQASMSRAPRGFVSPARWASGVPAATLNYGLNAYRSTSTTGRETSSAYVRMGVGLNAAGWRFRQQGALSWTRGDRLRTSSFARYATHDLTRLRSEILVGEAATTGELFDALSFVGVQVRTDDRMFADSVTGYAPVVRGVARTNANVVIRQNGYEIYQMAVAPGPFVIDDMYPSGFGGDLDVVVMESDGSESRFTVPFASVPRLLRPGMQRHAATLGRVRSAGGGASVPFAEATLQRGVSNAMTLFTGMQGADAGRYMSGIGGAAFNTRAGAMSADVTVTQARHGRGGTRSRGHSIRATYSKNLAASATNISFAAFRHSSEGFLTLGDASALRDADRPGDGRAGRSFATRHTLQLSLAQELPGGWGSVFATGATSDYWQRSGTDRTWQLGYNQSWRIASYAVTASRTRNASGRSETQLNLNLSMPLGRSDRGSRRLGVNYLTSGDRQERRAMFSGTAGARGRVSYQGSVSQEKSRSATWSAGGGYQLPYATLNGTVGHSVGSAQQSFSVNGGIVAHAGGITLAPSLPETVAIVHAPGAEGARVLGMGDSRIDRRGYAIATHLRPYRENTIALDPGDADELVHLSSSSQRATPRAGAVVLLNFGESSSRAYILRMVDGDGKPLPFGADVRDASGAVVGTVAQGGYAYLYKAQPGLNMDVRWVAGGMEAACRFQVPAVAPASGDVSLIPCQAPGGLDQVENPPRVRRDELASAPARRTDTEN